MTFLDSLIQIGRIYHHLNWFDGCPLQPDQLMTYHGTYVCSAPYPAHWF